MTGTPEIIQGAYVKRGPKRRLFRKVDLGPILFPTSTPGGVVLTPEFWAGEIPTRQALLDLKLRESRRLDLRQTAAERRQESQEDLITWMIRSPFVRGYSFAMPCREALEFIAGHTRSILEIGAGTGFWASLLTRVGVDVVATDGGEPLFARKQVRGSHYPVALQDATEAVKANPARDLLTIWPSAGPWLASAVDALAPGRLLIYVGEVNADFSGDDRFWDLVESRSLFEPVAGFSMVRFPGMKDILVIMRKRGGSA